MLVLLCGVIWIVRALCRKHLPRVPYLFRRPRPPIAVPPVAPTAVPIVPKRKRRPPQPGALLWPVWSKIFAPHEVYCGPVAASALVGADVDQVISLIQEHRGDKLPVEDTNAHDLSYALQRFGRDIRPAGGSYLTDTQVTLGDWERARTEQEFKFGWLVAADDHWFAVRGSWFCDSKFSRSVPMKIYRGPHRRSKVKAVYVLVQGPPQLSLPLIAA